MSVEEAIRSRDELEELRGVLVERREGSQTRITVCAGTGCIASGAEAVVDAFREAIADRGLTDQVEVKSTGCHGFCEMGPLVTLQPSDYFYPQVRTRDADRILERTVLEGEPIEELFYQDPQTEELVPRESEVPFYKNQDRIILEENGHLDPTDLEDFIAIGGYGALARALMEMDPEEIVDAVIDSGLRGRGGAGFPAGLKWKAAREQPTAPKYVVCNADEGDPGAYMDRSLLEGNPHRVLEGMCIGAFAIGVSQGFVYVRHEYPLAVRNITKAIEDARKAGILGENVFGSGFSFDVKVVRGAGAFVCGEETALIASLEGRKGEPRQRPPFPAESGFQGKPTIINNVETWANVPHIVNNGAEWFASYGSEGSKGTKIFSLVGKVNNTGLVEVPMGTSVRSIVYDIGGGIPDGKAFKAVQTGGPAGGCLPEEELDLPIDFEALGSAGTIMGSGGLIVMDESTCMVDVARYFTRFLEEESCGKCYSCRKGTQRMRELLDQICEGEGTLGHIDLLQELGSTVNLASMCGLGQNAATPVLSTIRYFRDEFEAHILEHRCPAGVCSALIRYEIMKDLCDGCHACSQVCPSDSIDGDKDHIHTIDSDTCIKCGSCVEVCAKDAVIVTSGDAQ
jgi:NADH:ubiquinone oxidoreductase subunit F (NADH-binding)/(2Fe-2S) ferredoxin/NAD-dependent dihydropyrimidine dehydrogenase PreA subunit